MNCWLKLQKHQWDSYIIFRNDNLTCYKIKVCMKCGKEFSFPMDLADISAISSYINIYYSDYQ